MIFGLCTLITLSESLIDEKDLFYFTEISENLFLYSSFFHISINELNGWLLINDIVKKMMMSDLLKLAVISCYLNK
jgi:hypothetical protein